MPKYKAVIQYVGGGYAGWQIQPGRPTVQETLREALHRVSREDASWIAAGRTDSGVHALGQTAHFILSRPFPVERLIRSINGVLPADIRLQKLIRVRDSFHAQKEARRKRYEYRIYNGPFLPPFLNGYVEHVPRNLDVEAMQLGARLLRGTWDFSAFAASSGTVLTRVRTLSLSNLSRKGPHLTYAVEADGFLQHMVRNIVGTLLQIGDGRRDPVDVLRLLASRNRRNAGPTAAARGLYLVKVYYSGPHLRRRRLGR